MRLAVRAALVAMAPAIAASIDGDWLRELARRAGDSALDAAIALAPDVPGGGVAAVAGDAIDALGFDLMRAAVPGVLHRYLEWAPSAVRRCDAALARFAVAAAAREGTA